MIYFLVCLAIIFLIVHNYEKIVKTIKFFNVMYNHIISSYTPSNVKICNDVAIITCKFENGSTKVLELPVYKFSKNLKVKIFSSGEPVRILEYRNLWDYYLIGPPIIVDSYDYKIYISSYPNEEDYPTKICQMGGNAPISWKDLQDIKLENLEKLGEDLIEACD